MSIEAMPVLEKPITERLRRSRRQEAPTVVEPERSKKSPELVIASRAFQAAIEHHARAAARQEDTAPARTEAQQAFHFTAEEVKDYPAKLALLRSYWNRPPFDEQILSLPADKHWDPSMTEKRLQTWDKTQQLPESFDPEKFVTNEEAAAVENDNDQVLNFLQKETSVDEEVGERFYGAVRVLNLTRRVRGNEPRITEAYRTDDPALHKERLLVARPDTRGQTLKEGSAFDTLVYFVSAFDKTRPEERVLKQQATEQIAVFLRRMVTLSAQADGPDFEGQILQLTADINEAKARVYSQLNGAGKQIYGRDRQADFGLALAGNDLPEQARLTRVDFRSPPRIGYGELAIQYGQPESTQPPAAEARSDQTLASPDRASRPERPSHEPAPYDMLREDAPISFTEARRIGNELLPYLPEGVDQQKFLAIVFEVSKYKPDLSSSSQTLGYEALRRSLPRRRQAGIGDALRSRDAQGQTLDQTFLFQLLEKFPSTRGQSEAAKQARFVRSGLVEQLLVLYQQLDTEALPSEPAQIRTAMDALLRSSSFKDPQAVERLKVKDIAFVNQKFERSIAANREPARRQELEQERDAWLARIKRYQSNADLVKRTASDLFLAFADRDSFRLPYGYQEPNRLLRDRTNIPGEVLQQLT
ncbi:MAG: hypothetical protein HY461_01695 [Parcubacteria group bacterium]|nr:hypothetical protein [Parcubacteria group bacterium]